MYQFKIPFTFCTEGWKVVVALLKSAQVKCIHFLNFTKNKGSSQIHTKKRGHYWFLFQTPTAIVFLRRLFPFPLPILHCLLPPQHQFQKRWQQQHFWGTFDSSFRLTCEKMFSAEDIYWKHFAHMHGVSGNGPRRWVTFVEDESNIRQQHMCAR